jgi:hypothetical protein
MIRQCLDKLARFHIKDENLSRHRRPSHNSRRAANLDQPAVAVITTKKKKKEEEYVRIEARLNIFSDKTKQEFAYLSCWNLFTSSNSNLPPAEEGKMRRCRMIEFGCNSKEYFPNPERVSFHPIIPLMLSIQKTRKRKDEYALVPSSSRTSSTP